MYVQASRGRQRRGVFGVLVLVVLGLIKEIVAWQRCFGEGRTVWFVISTMGFIGREGVVVASGEMDMEMSNEDRAEENKTFCYKGCSGNGRCVHYKCDLNLTMDTYNSFCKGLGKKEVVLVGASTSSCAKCGLVEAEYNQTLPELNRMGVKFARLDVMKERKLATKLEILKVPSIVLLRSRCKYHYPYLAQHSALDMMVFASKQVDGSVMDMANYDQLGTFIHERLLANLNKFSVVFALGVFNDKTGFQDEQKDFKTACKQLQHIPEIYCARTIESFRPFRKVDLQAMGLSPAPLLILLNFEISRFAQEIKDGLGDELEKWLASTTGIERVERRMYHDLKKGIVITAHSLAEDLDGKMSIERWIFKHSTPLVGELTSETFARYEQLRMPMLILFIGNDYKDKPDQVVDAFRHVAAIYHTHVLFATADATKLAPRMRVLGLFDGAEKTAIAINTMSDKVLEPFPGDPRSKAELRKYVEDFLTMRLSFIDPAEIARKHEEKFGKSPQTGSQDLVPGVREKFDSDKDDIVVLTLKNITEGVLHDETRDVVVLFHADHCDGCLAAAPYYKKVGTRFKQLGIKSVVIARMDVTVEPPPPSFVTGNMNLPVIMMAPAFMKEPPFIYFSAVLKVATLMDWIEQNAGIKFKLPELAQFEEQDKILFKQQIEQRERRRMEADPSNQKQDKDEL